MSWFVSAAALAAVLVVVWVASGRRHRFAYWGQVATAEAIGALATDGWRLERLAVEPGVELLGLSRPPRDAAAGWVVFLPGNAGAVLAGFRPVLDDVVRRHGCGVVLFAPRGFDASTGAPSPAGLLQDARAVWRLAGERAGEAGRRSLWGYSLGAVPAVQLAAELCERGAPPAELLLLSAAPRLALMPPGLLGRFCASHVYDAAVAAPRVSCPTRLIHGERDDALSVAEAERLRLLLGGVPGGSARLEVLAGRGHVDYLAELGKLVAPVFAPVGR